MSTPGVDLTTKADIRVAGDGDRGRRLAERAALRHVAAMVISGASPDRLFHGVTHELSKALGLATVVLTRLEQDGRSVVLSSVGEPHAPLHGRARRAPIVVGGAQWGAISVAGPRSSDVDAAVEQTLASFAKLVSITLGTDDAGDDLRPLLREQHALKRAANDLARRVSSDEMSAVVAEELAAALSVPNVTLGRYMPDGSVLLVASTGEGVPVGLAMQREDEIVGTMVLEAASYVRIDDCSMLPASRAEMCRRLGISSAIGVAIVIAGSAWGVIWVTAGEPDWFTEETEERINDFSEMLATSIVDLYEREDFERLAEEQASLRRIATLVAREAPPGVIFDAVATEVGQLVTGVQIEVGRYEHDGSVTILGGTADPPFLVGSRWPLDGPSAFGSVLETGRIVRIDDYGELAGSIAEGARTVGFASAIGAPIVVDGKTWGAVIAATTARDGLRPEAESRLSGFTELIATAISNVQARDGAHRLAQEQAALRRIATLVAREAPPREVFDAVATEAEGLLNGAQIEVGRYGSDRTVTVVSATGSPPFVAGQRWALGGKSAFNAVFETAGLVQIDDYTESTSEIGHAAEVEGFVCSIGAPIVVDGELWGAVVAASKSRELLPPGSEKRLSDFTELIATAVSNLQARDQTRRLADEQAALRRIATLIAEQAPPAAIFDAVAGEARQVLETERIDIFRCYPDGTSTIVSSTGTPAVAIGQRWRPNAPGIVSTVRNTQRAARIEDFTSLPGRVAQLARGDNVLSAVGVPIMADGEMWGIVVAFASDALPADTEARLGAFTQLTATAISNVQARDDLRLLAEEQGALRRVATQVARGVSADQLFAAVAEEACVLIGADDTRVARYEGATGITVLAGYGALSDNPPAGSHVALDGPSVTATVLRTGRPARLDDELNDAIGSIGALARANDVTCTVGAPIVVEGQLWGVVVSSWHGHERPAPEGVEEQLAAFTPLIATAISNVQARDGLRRLAEEQGALRRVATLVAQGAPPSAIFGAVAGEASRLLGVERVDIDRFRSDGKAELLGSAGHVPVPFDQPWLVQPPSVAATVRDTGRPARIDNFRDLSSDTARTARAVGIRSVVGVPIVVGGSIWGIMMTLAPERLPEETERRLADFTDLVASAISQAQARDDLITSRARIVTASDETRRRIERNLHDGVQQRMLALGLSLRAVRAAIPAAQSDARTGLDRVDGELERLLEEIRDISRGLHPALLSRAGLGPSLRTLARRSPIPVILQVVADPRPPEPIEIAIYYIVSEALSNSAKHSGAPEVSVAVEVDAVRARVVIADEGAGGAAPGGGSGLIGLIDRAEALGGRFTLDSPPGAGTTLTVELPVSPAR